LRVPFQFLLSNLLPSRTETILVNGRPIPVILVRSLRARRYILRLRNDGVARLTMPRNGSTTEAWKFAQRHIEWLAQQLQNLSSRTARSKEWFAGTEILFRGERIKIEADANQIRLANESFPAGKSIADTNLRPLIEKRLRALAEKELRARTLEFAALHQLAVQHITIRAQRSRWGSCSSGGVISLNWRLVQIPPFVRDYIILHELMHLRQMNHSSRFWMEVAQVCPDYRRAKLWLKENPGMLEPA
jgi:predicted metal-dependent hydrolase